LAQFEKTKRKFDPNYKSQIERVECPASLRYLFGWFCQLYRGEPLTFQEVKAFSDLKRLDLEPFEVDALIEVSF
jgi:hypothetical protein